MKYLLTGLALSIAAGGAAYAVENQMDTVTRAEAQTKAGERFARMDANKDGKLDAADRTARQAAMFDMIDTNKDGQISRAEFDAHRAARMDGDRPDRPDMDGHDKDRKGDRMGHGRRRGDRMGMDGMRMGAMADANKDGAVTQAEFVAAALSRFDRADTDKNGSLTTTERRAARTAMRQAVPATVASQPAN